ncbi:MAG: long-chain fatty acid--CoA ligase [Acidimicrobiia bacterium]|nr:long-chain fatty acid--CoA ligase [Acidimicrobiia bacterium]
MSSTPDTRGLIAPSARPIIPGDGPQTAADVLERGLRDFPDRDALVGRSGRATYVELERLVNQVANGLRGMGVSEGDRVGGCMPNDLPIVVAFLACMRIGAIWVGINRALAPPEQQYLLDDAEVSLLLEPDGDWLAFLETGDTTRPVLPGGGDIDPFAPAAIAYTSGTTGFPKGAVHSQHNLLLPGAVARSRGQYSGDDRFGVMLPLTLLNLIALGPLLAYQVGGTCVAIDRVDAPGLATWIRDERVTSFASVPAILHGLLTHPDVSPEDLASLRTPGVGGADCPEAFRELYRERYHAEVTIGYGLTEAPTAVTMTRPDEAPVPNSSGRALPHVRVVPLDQHGNEVAPGEIGELCIGPTLDGEWTGVYTPMLGYWKQPEATAAALRDGMLHTGDLGSVDEHGEVFVADRRNDLIIRGGANVYPAEVERVLYQDARVAACAVVGAPDERLGERVVAFVQPQPGATVDVAELRALCEENLARYKVPERFEIVGAFERTPMGKIKKTGLRKIAETRML